MRNALSIPALVLIFAAGAASGRCRVEGVILARDTDQALAGANVMLVELNRGTVSSRDGRFMLDHLPCGKYTLRIVYMGYHTLSRSLDLSAGTGKCLRLFLIPEILPMKQVVVTATRYEKNERDIVLPINVVTRKQLSEALPNTVCDALEAEPGLTLRRDGLWGTDLNIRGLQGADIVAMIDGFRIDTATDLAAGLSLIDVHDIEQVEVIRGAASALYGTGAVGGVLNIRTAGAQYSDTTSVHAVIRGGYSTINRGSLARFQLGAGAPKWNVKISASMRRAGDARTPDGPLPNSQFRDGSLSARFNCRTSSNHELRFNLQRYRASDVGIPGGRPLFPETAEVSYPKAERELSSVEYHARRMTAFLPNLVVRVFRQKIVREVEIIPNRHANQPGSPASTINVSRITPGAAHLTRGLGLQADLLPGRGQRLSLGADLWQKDLDSHRERFSRIDLLDPQSGAVTESYDQVTGEQPLPDAFYRSAGLFIHDEMALFRGRLTLTLGSRIDRIWVKNEPVVQPAYLIVNGVRTDSPAGQIRLWPSRNESDLSYSANLGMLFRSRENVDFTLNLGMNFRSPYLEERYQYIDLGSLVKIGNPALDPERGFFSDLGVRLWSGSFSLTGNLFVYRLRNLVTEVSSTFEDRAALRKTNTGSAQLHGFDLEIKARLSQRASVALTAAWVQGQDTFLNRPLPLIPPLNIRCRLGIKPARLFSTELITSAFAPQDRIADWEIPTPGYFTVALRFRTERLRMLSLNSRIYFNVENVLNRSYRNHLATNRGRITAEPGRNFILQWQIES